MMTEGRDKTLPFYSIEKKWQNLLKNIVDKQEKV